VAQSMAATCHMFIGLKSLHLAGVDPVTSGQGKALGKAAQPVHARICYLTYVCVVIYLNLQKCVLGREPGRG
jgi:hypothetical protein